MIRNSLICLSVILALTTLTLLAIGIKEPFVYRDHQLAHVPSASSTWKEPVCRELRSQQGVLFISNVYLLCGAPSHEFFQFAGFGITYDLGREGKFAFERRGLRIPLWAPLMVFTIYPILAFIKGPLRRRYRTKRNLCQQCGYNLEGNTSGRCPECGELIDVSSGART